MTIAIKNSLFALLLFGILACGKSPVYNHFVDVENLWFQDSVITFKVPIDDVSATYGINVLLRHNADYPFANLYMFRKIESADALIYQDTVNFQLADPSGKWLGSGIGELKTVARRYRNEAVRFSAPGTYTFYIQQGMRIDSLMGIDAVGLELFKIEEEKND